MRRILVTSLQRVGLGDVVEAGDGREALARFDATVQLVVTDWQMPHMNGTELARALRARGEQVPILLVTARSVREDLLEAAAAGVTGYIVKPFTPQRLREKIDALHASTPATPAAVVG